MSDNCKNYRDGVCALDGKECISCDVFEPEEIEETGDEYENAKAD
jgi:hypothetical protein